MFYKLFKQTHLTEKEASAPNCGKKTFYPSLELSEKTEAVGHGRLLPSKRHKVRGDYSGWEYFVSPGTVGHPLQKH